MTIPAGADSATFPVTVVNDDQIDGNETATITASASGFLSGSDSAVVVDDNVPHAQPDARPDDRQRGRRRRRDDGHRLDRQPREQPLTIVLASSDTTAATVPASVVIDAGQTSASFPIAAVNNGLDIGNQTAIITANVETNAGVVLTQGSAEASLLLLNANGPALSLSFAASTVDKGATATATVTRNTATTDAAGRHPRQQRPDQGDRPAHRHHPRRPGLGLLHGQRHRQTTSPMACNKFRSPRRRPGSTPASRRWASPTWTCRTWSSPA